MSSISVHPLKKARNKRKGNSVIISIALLISLCFVAENIGWSKSIAHEMTERRSQEDIKTNDEQYEDGGSAFCLLVRDDNDIIPEWIAYHYHVFRMRRLIVAMDPDSKTSPLEVLKPWASKTSHESHFHLDFTLWNDEDYTPGWFHGDKKDYTKIPNSVEKEVTCYEDDDSKKDNNTITHSIADINSRPIKDTIWHRNITYVKEHQDEVKFDIHKVNNHRFRQKKFVSECFRKVKKEHQQQQRNQQQQQQSGISWTVHIDTDEYLVPNPWISSYIMSGGQQQQQEQPSDSNKKHGNENSNDKAKRHELEAFYPQQPSDGSLWNFFNRYLGEEDAPTQRSCVMMPRILFGSREDGDGERRNHTLTTATSNIVSWNHTNFESLRWKYHADFHSGSRPKAMVKVSQLSLSHHQEQKQWQWWLPWWNKGNNGDELLEGSKIVRSIHRPLTSRIQNGGKGCLQEPLEIYSNNRYEEPLAVYHYLGSLQRYLSRGDIRRDSSVYERYNEDANFAKGDWNHNSDNESYYPWWIGGWLDSFVETHGTETALTVLGEYDTTL